ncbi:MAG: class I SAM-dependent methyltransferase [Tagaea sp.]
MSRLDGAIARLSAQRDLLDWACRDLAPGPVLELGLGNGRTYDHLRARLGRARAIHVFERHLAAHPSCLPPPEFLHAGDMRETLPAWARAHGRASVFAHADTGSGDDAQTAAFAAFLAASLPACLAPDALVLSDQRLDAASFAPFAPPVEIPPGRYFCYRAR